MNQKQARSQSNSRTVPVSKRLGNSYYALLGLPPSASVIDIRRAYRELSKRYHPDTTELPTAVATVKFQQLNEAYATLSNPERRMLYDAKIGYSRFNVIQAPPDLDKTASGYSSNSAYLDPSDRPLSPGEIFALFILGITFIACLLLAIIVGLTQGNSAWQVPDLNSSMTPSQEVLIFPSLVSEISKFCKFLN